MTETVKEHCKHKDCRYRGYTQKWTDICQYMLITGKPRGCGISDCDKYKAGKVETVSTLEGIKFADDV